jgi:GNAT superfamily N-acetyltransferase
LLRLATIDDIPALVQLIETSARGLGKDDYTAAQIQGALQGTFGVDTQLIRDGTYWLFEGPKGIMAAGGWSYRTTLFGGDQHADRVASLLDPAVDAARIRAFFVHPDAARQGLGRRLLMQCEAEAMARGFHKLTLFATLPGLRLYETCGFTADPPLDYEVVAGTQMTFVPMHKTIPGPPSA